MNDHKHTSGHHSGAESRSDDDQLRPETTNEAIREAAGSPDTDLGKLSSGTNRHSGDYASDAEEIQGSDLTQGMSLNPNDASAVRSGGTTDMDDQTVGGAGLATGKRGSSNLTTRRTVTGSDFDGQDKTS